MISALAFKTLNPNYEKWLIIRIQIYKFSTKNKKFTPKPAPQIQPNMSFDDYLKKLELKPKRPDKDENYFAKNTSKNLTELDFRTKVELKRAKDRDFLRKSLVWKTNKGFGGIPAFLDLQKEDLEGKIGSAWPTKYLEKKSFSDLHKLWYVLIKERNRLQSERWYRRDADLDLDQSKTERFHKVEKTMRRIKCVVKSRNLEYKKNQSFNCLFLKSSVTKNDK